MEDEYRSIEWLFLFLWFHRMEYRLVLNNRSEYDIPNSVLSGQLHQDLKYYKFRRVSSKIGKPIFYLFFRREEDTYHALRAAKSMKDISLVRYRHREGTAPPLERSDDLTASEMQYRPVPPQDIVDLIRHNYTNYLDKFASKVWSRFTQYVLLHVVSAGFV